MEQNRAKKREEGLVAEEGGSSAGGMSQLAQDLDDLAGKLASILGNVPPEHPLTGGELEAVRRFIEIGRRTLLSGHCGFVPAAGDNVVQPQKQPHSIGGKDAGSASGRSSYLKELREGILYDANAL